MRPAILFLLAAVLAPAATRYEASNENFPNPERGFFIQRSYNPGSRRPGRPLTLESLRAAREKGITLLRMVYTLSEFRETPLSAEFLQRVGADFELARQAGLKVIPRFAYNAGPIGAPDAGVERALQHIGQLKPALRENADVIAFLEAGFAGAWGEWHNSTNGLFDDVPGAWWKSVNGRTRAIVAGLLDALPGDRMIAVRCPRFKIELSGAEPLSPRDAYTASAKARTGAHNDCFLASKDDMGTYTPGRLPEEKEFLHRDNLFVPQGGETCSSGKDAQPYIGCANALKEFAYLRYSALNIDYQQTVLRGWETGGCMAEIERRMGYRFRLVESRIPESVRAGGTLKMSFTVANDGWANLYNPRPVQVVLRNTQTRKESRFDAREDPRLWMPGENKTVEAAAVIPAEAAPGTYDVLLDLPDAAARLKGRAEYSIRLANQDVWEPSTGMNSLRRTITVEAGRGGRAPTRPAAHARNGRRVPIRPTL